MTPLDSPESVVAAEGAGEKPGFDDAFLLLFAIWALIGHLAFFGGFTLREYWLTAGAASALGLLALTLRAANSRARFGMFPHSASGFRPDWPRSLAILLGVGLALCLHRPDADDSLYLAQQVAALDGSETAFSALASVAEYNAGYVMSTYEFLRAGFSWLTGIPLLVSYYLVWPSVIAAMAVACQYRLLKLAGVTHLALAMAGWFVVMVAWGDVHRTPPNFGFVRMFQGKAALIWVVIPAAQYHWLRFVEFKDRRSLLLLYAALIAGIGFSPSGVPTGVLLIGLFAAATLFRCGLSRGQWRITLAIAGGAVYPVIAGLLMRFHFGHVPESGQLASDVPPVLGALTAFFGLAAGSWLSTLALPDSVQAVSIFDSILRNGWRVIVAISCMVALPAVLRPTRGPVLFLTYPLLCALLFASPWPPEPSVQNVSMVDYVLGHGGRSLIALGCLAALPAFLRRSRVRALFSTYSILCVLLLAFPWTSELLARFAYSSFSWRWLFLLPFALSVTLATERVAGWFRPAWAQWTVAVALAMAFAGASPRWVVSEENYTRLQRPGFKLPSEHEVTLLGYSTPARVEGLWLISPATGRRY